MSTKNTGTRPDVVDGFWISQLADEVRIDVIFVERHSCHPLSLAHPPGDPTSTGHGIGQIDFPAAASDYGPIIEEESINTG
jgi:hypothetical protein